MAIAKNPKPFFSVSPDIRVSYINVVIRNTAIKIWNTKHKIAENETDLDESIVDELLSNEGKMLSDFSCKRILEFIGTMPVGVRSAVYLRQDLGLTNSDIANTLGISEEAARKRIARAINQIKQYMEDLRNE